MKFKLSFEEPKFFINEKKGIVTCVMEYRFAGADYVLKDIADLFFGNKDLFGCDNPLKGYYTTVTASAKLDPQDKFDVEKGKKVARAKAESQAYRFISKTLSRVLEKYLTNLTISVGEFQTKALGVIEHNDRYIKQF